MNKWPGHRPVTTKALLVVFDRLLAAATELSVPEQILYTACETWAAVVTRTLLALLDSDPGDTLRSATVAFESIGALRTAATLRRAADEVAVAPTARRRRECLVAVEDRLVCTDDAVDSLIVQYARRYLRGKASGPEWPWTDTERAPAGERVH